jgi:hypothetical protein
MPLIVVEHLQQDRLRHSFFLPKASEQILHPTFRAEQIFLSALESRTYARADQKREQDGETTTKSDGKHSKLYQARYPLASLGH